MGLVLYGRRDDAQTLRVWFRHCVGIAIVFDIGRHVTLVWRLHCAATSLVPLWFSSCSMATVSSIVLVPCWCCIGIVLVWCRYCIALQIRANVRHFPRCPKVVVSHRRDLAPLKLGSLPRYPEVCAYMAGVDGLQLAVFRCAAGREGAHSVLNFRRAHGWQCLRAHHARRLSVLRPATVFKVVF